MLLDSSWLLLDAVFGGNLDLLARLSCLSSSDRLTVVLLLYIKGMDTKRNRPSPSDANHWVCPLVESRSFRISDRSGRGIVSRSWREPFFHRSRPLQYFRAVRTEAFCRWRGQRGDAVCLLAQDCGAACTVLITMLITAFLSTWLLFYFLNLSQSTSLKSISTDPGTAYSLLSWRCIRRRDWYKSTRSSVCLITMLITVFLFTLFF